MMSYDLKGSSIWSIRSGYFRALNVLTKKSEQSLKRASVSWPWCPGHCFQQFPWQRFRGQQWRLRWTIGLHLPRPVYEFEAGNYVAVSLTLGWGAPAQNVRSWPDSWICASLAIQFEGHLVPGIGGFYSEPMMQYFSYPGTPDRLLRALLFELSIQAYSAHKAGQRLLEGSDEPWEDIQLLVSHSATVGAFLWPLPSRNKRLGRNKRLIEAFPKRGEVLREIVNVSEEMKTLKDLRDAMVHVDERLEKFILENPEGPLILRSTAEHEHTDGNFLSWISETKTVTYFESRVEVEPLVALLKTVQENASRGVMMLHSKSGDALAGDPYESRPILILPPMPIHVDPEN